MNKYFLPLIFGIVLLSFIGFSNEAAAIVATGGTITTTGGNKVHTFKSSGFFCVTSGSGNVQTLVIAGGGGGGGDLGGGGGAGGYRLNSTYPVHVGCYTVTIGAGGAGGSSAVGSNGGNSVFGNFTSTGGGGGGHYNGVNGVAGGSGGGGGAGDAGTGTGGAASPAGQGNVGGNALITAPFANSRGGGGGGAGAAGATGTASGNGGTGTTTALNGTSACFAGGGGGGSSSLAAGTGACGGGNGVQSGGGNGRSAQPNTGSGGGGGNPGTGVGGAGGSGIVFVVYPITAPDAVNTLHSVTITTTSVSVAWTAPSMNGGTCSGYQVNYTSPFGIPLTILQNNTGVCTTTYNISGLTLGTDYSFRVSARNEAGTNVTGANILNATTLTFNEANFTIGSFNYNANNPVLLPIRYERIDSGTQARVNVTFANTISLACDLRYTYAGTNHTYHSITSIPVSSSEREASFLFTNSSNDIVTFHCWNQAGNQSANYVLTQANFLLLQQIHDFRNGTYGTMGQLGAFDFITLIVVIIAMIGLNRTNEAVGGFFCIVAVTILTYFGIIQWYIALISAIAVVIMLMISSTRKD